MSDENTQQQPAGGVTTPPAGEQTQTVQASPDGTVTAPNGDTMVTDKEKVDFSEASGEGTLPPQPPVDNDHVEPGAEQFDEPVKIYYMSQEIVERLGKFDADGAEECKLADGSTTYVPKSVLGE